MTIPAAPPNYGTLSGQLFLYAAGRAAFESSLVLSESTPERLLALVEQFQPNKCILLGGLSDGLLPVPYASQLEQACRRSNWSMVQPILSSSYLGFGNGSLQRDTGELDELMEYLVQHRGATGSMALVGHSTGCQNAIHYLRHGSYASKLSLVVLQAPVSDREHAMMDAEAYSKYLQVAQEMRQNGCASEMMPRDAFWAPITAARYLDLHEKGGADDFFSSDYTDEELNARLRHVGQVPDGSKRTVLVTFSGSDEYVPDHVNSRQLTDRLLQAMNVDCEKHTDSRPVAQGLYLPTANHNLSLAEGDAACFVAKVEELLFEALR